MAVIVLVHVSPHPQDAVSELKERVRAQYQRMHALLEANQAETVQMLENTFTVYVRKNSQQVLQLNERRQQAEKLLSSVQTFFQRSESINFMKVQICTSLSMSPTSDYVCAAMETHIKIHQLKVFDSIHSIVSALCVLLSFSEHKTLSAANGQVSIYISFLIHPIVC